MAQAKRVQMYFPNELYLTLAGATQREKVSMAEIVRRALRDYFKKREPDWRNDPLWKMCGAGKGCAPDGSMNVDYYVYGWKSKKGKS